MSRFSKHMHWLPGRWIVKGLLVLMALHSASFGQQQTDTEDYPAIFGDDYRAALVLIEEEPWVADTLRAHGLDPWFALSVVFPEMIRYSSIMDYLQLKGLEVLYVQNGAGYSDFSVGWFQMKPSFAERIEADILGNNLDSAYPTLAAIRADTTASPEARKNRLDRLKDPYFQVLYLEAFLRWMDRKYAAHLFLSEDEKLAFYATAYNAGYFKDEAVIREEMRKARFYTGLDGNGRKYRYSEVAVGFYEDVAK